MKLSSSCFLSLILTQSPLFYSLIRPGIVRTATQGQTISVVSEVNSLITRYINQVSSTFLLPSRFPFFLMMINIFFFFAQRCLYIGTNNHSCCRTSQSRCSHSRYLRTCKVSKCAGVILATHFHGRMQY